MARTTTVPELKVGDRLVQYGLELEVVMVTKYHKHHGYGIDCTQVRCRVHAIPDHFPLVYLDRDDGGYLWTVQGNEHARVTLRD